jgi:hypothetical protein
MQAGDFGFFLRIYRLEKIYGFFEGYLGAISCFWWVFSRLDVLESIKNIQPGPQMVIFLMVRRYCNVSSILINVNNQCELMCI